jgi:CPA2 family monovalent cation:H+ antiporter-2
MDLWYFLMEIFLLLGVAFLLGSLAQRFQQSNIIGYLLAGAILGPMLFNAKAVANTAEIGVSLLLFSIGLEFSFRRLRRLGVMALGGGSLQVVATIIIVMLVASRFASWKEAIALGALVALSSTAIVLRTLVDRSEIDSIRGRTSLGILLLQDIAIVPLVILVTLLAPGAQQGGVGMQLLKLAAASAGLALVLYVLLYHLIPKVLYAKGVFPNRELTVLLAVAIALGSAWFSHTLGISPALGAFIAGIILGESPFATQISADIGPLRIIMVTLFFTSVGMLAQPVWMLTHTHLILLGMFSIFIVKVMVTFGVCRIFGLDARHSLSSAITLGQMGEFSFVLAAAAKNLGLMNENMSNLMISIIIGLMFLAPYMVTHAQDLADFIIRRLLSTSKTAGWEVQDHDDGALHPLIVGFGPAGQSVAQALKSKAILPSILDINPDSINKAGREGFTIHIGDASREEVLLHSGILNACLAVVTIPDPRTARRVIAAMRSMVPQLGIIVRCRYHRSFWELEKAGADIIVDEEFVVGESLSERVVEYLAADTGQSLACRLSGSVEA